MKSNNRLEFARVARPTRKGEAPLRVGLAGALCIMSSKDDRVHLVARFRRLGYHVSHSAVAGLDTIVVSAKPEIASGVTLYQRSLQVQQDSEGQWHTTLGMITLPWEGSIDALYGFASVVMESDDAYFQEQQRRVRDSGNA